VAGGALAFSLGALLAIAQGGKFDPARFVLGYSVVLLGDLSTHYSNDYFDVEVDKYIDRKKFFAGSNLLVSNPDLYSLSKIISIALLAISNFLAVLFVILFDAPIEFLIIILCASIVGWFYSAPPLRLSSRGVGEVAVAWVTGFAIPGLGYLSIRSQLDPLFVYFAIPFMMYGLVLSLSLEVPDVDVDRRGKRRNIAVRKGQHSVFLLILATTFLATAIFGLYAWQISSPIVDFGAVFLFSIVPSLAGLIGFVGIVQKREVNSFSALNIASLFFFNIILISYLFTVVT
jgi:1,4-dihydroxy-2-naphthoate octaprenyltransferase